ncbi:MAG TPA: MotA/TolQ/ExbB proton channel family protein [Kofleriaceae bacterium]|jgi:biopolymer transport protein ExbB/TolQ|nr:MotA/TolQ/ExbB proton channel family protein [Kofleriaceae bacterium]
MDLAQAFVDFAQLGANWVLWLLILLSVISVGVMIDRFLWFRGRDTDTERFLRELRGAFERDELERLEKKYKDDPAIPVQVALRGVRERARGAEVVAEAMHGERARWRRGADRNLMILGTLGNNVPFVGLFGTVLGVISAFQNLTVKSAEAERLTLNAIAEALVATAVGLLVAIPAVAAFNYFGRKLKVVMTGADECAHAVLEQVYAQKTRPVEVKPAGAAEDKT